MPWLKKAGEMPRNEKIWELSDPMYRLYDGSLHYCAENLTDGHVPASRITALTPKPATKPQIEALVSRRLWHRLPALTCKSCLKLRAEHRTSELPRSGYLVHDFLEFNPSRLEWEAEQARRKALAALGGHARADAIRSRAGSGTASSTDSGAASRTAEPLSTASSAAPLAAQEPPYPVLRTPSSGSSDPVSPDDELFADDGEDGSLKRSEGRREGGLHHAGKAFERVAAQARGRAAS